jgi:outer membrane protein assembly factor BamA
MFQPENNRVRSLAPAGSSFLLLFLIILSAHLSADSRAKSQSGQITIIEKDEENKLGITILPILYYTPETKLAFGAGSLFTYRFGLFFKHARPSTLYLAAVYTQMKQFSLQVKPEIYLQNNSLFLTGNFLAERFPTKFWGIGADVDESLVESYTPQTYFMEIGFQRKLFQRTSLYLGLKYHLESCRILEKKSGGLLDQGLISGSDGGLLSGLGVIVSFDNRDNIFSPTSGYYLQAFGFWNDRIFGSDFNYFSLRLDLRNYLSVADGQVLAFQGVLGTSLGEVPFYKLPRIGGDSLLRGYYNGRFRDRNLVAFQAEYRFPIWKKFSGVVFGAMGSLADRFRDLNWDNLKYAAGLGLRFKIIPKERANLRIDFAFGPGSTGIYFKAGEAF